MAIFRFPLDSEMPEPCRGGAVTIGNFDGVHLGHQALIAEAVRQAKLLGVSSTAVTFDPHPSQILRPDRIGPFLTTIADRATLLHQYGIDNVLILETSKALLHLSAREFFDRIILGGLGVKALVEGFNFGFGRNREGTIDSLKAWCAAAQVEITLVPARELQGQPVSSSRVRGEILAGNVVVVSQLLGRPYRIDGIVQSGARRGTALGFPTANLHEVPTVIPGNGVYAVRAMLNGLAWPAAANVGPNPTFGETARKVEVHLIGFAGSIYGKRLAVDFTEKIRDTRPFANVQELITQIANDILAAKAILGA